jgi:hypothetical protein
VSLNEGHIRESIDGYSLKNLVLEILITSTNFFAMNTDDAIDHLFGDSDTFDRHYDKSQAIRHQRMLIERGMTRKFIRFLNHHFKPSAK